MCGASTQTMVATVAMVKAMTSQITWVFYSLNRRTHLHAS